VNTNAYNLKPGVVRNTFLKQDQGLSGDDLEEEENKDDPAQANKE
jgi:hypothetical protein